MHQAAEQWLEDARAGVIKNRSGERYKPSVLGSYELSLRARVLPDLGGYRLEDITRPMLQEFADRMVREGCTPSTIRNTLMPLRVIYKRAVHMEIVGTNPVVGLALPAIRGRRERIASPPEARQLLAALSPADRPIHAAAIYSGLRSGELQAVAWDDVDLATGVIHVRRAWDARNMTDVAPKSRAGTRKVPILGVVRDVLIELKLASGGAGLVFPGKSKAHFDHSSLRLRAITAWKAAGLVPIGLHECRHTFASLMIAAGVNAKALSVYMGHANIATTFDLYGHLMPGGEEEAAALADAYLERANTAARLAAITP